MCSSPATFGCSQDGADLAARISRLLWDPLAEGYAGTIALGTDTPTLPTAYLVDASRRSGAALPTWSWARRGRRCYLSAWRAAPELFTNVPWSTSTVYAESSPARAPAAAISALPTWFDIDRVPDPVDSAALPSGAPIAPDEPSPLWLDWRCDAARPLPSGRAYGESGGAVGESAGPSAGEGAGSSSTQLQGTVMTVRGLSSSTEPGFALASPPTTTPAAPAWI